MSVTKLSFKTCLSCSIDTTLGIGLFGSLSSLVTKIIGYPPIYHTYFKTCILFVLFGLGLSLIVSIALLISEAFGDSVGDRISSYIFKD